MARKVKFYYTFKVVDEPNDSGESIRVECHKWEATGEHLLVYKVRPNTEWQGCSCPAWRTCKHQKCVAEMLESGKIQEPHKWRWDEVNGWQQLSDIPDVSEVRI